MKHRKLFPICPDVCNPTCPSDCYPYSTPPSPPSPPLSPPLSTTKHSQNVSPYVVIIATLLCIVFLVISYYLIIVKNWCRPRRTQVLEDTDDSFGVDENRGLAIDHPIWYIRTVGLQQSIINSIAVVKYTKGDQLTEGTDCSICLNEFQDDEILRLLPKCNHSFHIPCIDTWLRSHTNCPVCRSGIVQTDTQDRANDGDQIRVPESNTQAGNVEVEENRTITEEQAETSNTRIDFDRNDIVLEEMQQMRRSISADSLFVEKIKLAMRNLSVLENAHKFEPAGDSSSKLKTPSINYDGASVSLQQESVSIKRSSSCGGRSFFSRHSRNPNSILPL